MKARKMCAFIFLQSMGGKHQVVQLLKHMDMTFSVIVF